MLLAEQIYLDAFHPAEGHAGISTERAPNSVPRLLHSSTRRPAAPKRSPAASGAMPPSRRATRLGSTANARLARTSDKQTRHPHPLPSSDWHQRGRVASMRCNDQELDLRSDRQTALQLVRSKEVIQAPTTRISRPASGRPFADG
jgi:hypothetical protein